LVDFSDELDPEFVGFGINVHLKQIEDVTPYVTVKHLSAKSIRGIDFVYPDRTEQRRIVARIKECMERVDEIGCLTSKVQQESGYLPQAFRFDLWKECLDRYPLVELRTHVSSAKNGLYKPREHHGSGSILLRMFNINGAHFDTTRLERLNVTEKEASDYAISNGDIIVSRVNSRELVGKSTVVEGLAESAVFEAMLIRLRVDAAKARQDVLAWLMNAPQFLHDLRMRAKHAIGQSSINQQDLLGSCLPLPPLDEQRRLAEKYADLGELAANLRNECSTRWQATDGLRDAVLRKAFAGEL
jgi:type I restriction enzyme S subunit